MALDPDPSQRNSEPTGGGGKVVPKAGATSPSGPSAAKPAGRSVPGAETLNADLTLNQDVVLGEFRLLRRLGRGGMSEVYLAEQTQLRRHVAVKVMRPELMLDENLRQRFQKEALAVAGLNHPNIVQVYTVGESNSRFYIAQEYVNGQNLREYLSKKGPPDLPVALHIMRQVAAALQAAGQAGIVHRDIKPENIMLARKGEVKVADFGLAKRSTQSDSQQLTQYGHTMGTPLYMSPEQVNGRSVDHRSDLYSFGVTCYHMLSGNPPFRGDNAITIAVQHLRETPKSLELLRSDLPPLLCRIVHKLMEKNPDDRYQSAAALLKELKRFSPNKALDPDSHPLDDSAAEPLARESQWKRLTHFVRHPIQSAIWVADQPLRRQWPRLLITCLIVLSLFSALGWVRRPVNPLKARATVHTGKPADSGVPAKTTPAEQYFLASGRREDKESWKAVADNFPDDKIFTPSALIELGLLHLSDRNSTEAQSCFDRLVAYGSLEPRWQAAGWLGQAAAFSQEGKFQQSQDLLREKSIELSQHLSPRLRRLAKLTIETNEQELKLGFDENLRRIVEFPPQ